MTHEVTDYLQQFRDAPEDDQKAMLFDALMNLLGDAVMNDDAEFIKNYARLVTEMWNDMGDTNA
jgi:hypothetical protein